MQLYNTLSGRKETMAVTTADASRPVAAPQILDERLFHPVRLGRYNVPWGTVANAPDRAR